MKYKIDWFAVTVWGSKEVLLALWDMYFKESLGALELTDRGGRGYKKSYRGQLGVKIYCSPIDQQNHFHIEIPGQACSCLPPEQIRRFMVWLVSWEGSGRKYSMKRIDMAYDYVPFTVDQVYHKLMDGSFRSWAKRETIKYICSPFQLQEDNKTMGTKTVYIGSKASTRQMRVYNMHGFVRLEVEFRHERAQVVAEKVLLAPVDIWAEKSVEHIRDFIDIYETSEKNMLWDNWKVFIKEIPRGYYKTNSANEKSAIKAKSWMMDQVAPWYFVIEKTTPEFLEKVKSEGSKRLKDYHKSVLDSFASG